VELVLTVERRDEVAAPLGDDQRPSAEYSKVAEYLDTASMLRGTGDENADGAFALRLVHYMTGSSSESGNPYWNAVGSTASRRSGRRLPCCTRGCSGAS
jgi:hypothetical protein